MSKSPSSALVRLSVLAPDPFTEIFVIDDRFRRIAGGVGSVEIEISPGIYKVRFRSGFSQLDQLVEVDPGMETVYVRGDLVQFHSAAPIADTANAQDHQRAAAERLSRQVTRSVGRGSQIFVFVRDAEHQPDAAPYTSISLHSADGTEIARLTDGALDLQEACAGLNLELDPGTYRLRVETQPLGVFEMFVVACPGWQSEVFMQLNTFRLGAQSLRRPGLKTASVHMAQMGTGFSADAETVRLAELARLGIETGRAVVSSDALRPFLTGKFSNPMLGIYAAHLLLMQSRPPHDLIDEIAANVEAMIGPHPDILALSLRVGSRRPHKKIRFPTPPMLRRSWDLIARSSLRRASLVPSGSLSDQVADNLLESGPWLLYQQPEIEAGRAEPVAFARSQRIVAGLVDAVTTPAGRARLVAAQQNMEAFSPLEHKILNAVLQAHAFAGAVETKTAELPIPSVSRLMHSLKAPSAAISRSAGSLLSKLDFPKDEMA